jgi:hypothetical protein
MKHTDWHAVQRKDGTIFLECGGPGQAYHIAFDVALDDFRLAEDFASAMNYYNARRW